MKLISVNKHTADVVLWTGYFGLFALVLVWSLWLSPSKQYPLPMATAIGLLPLVIPLRGVIKNRHRSIFWLSLLSLIYFFHGIGVFASNPALRWASLLEILAAILLCTGAWMSMRVIKLSAA
ncbi:MAG TPA: DUF2069 domain-containing protein [Crenotrichaceae bacterium]|nr:DUF2069 domain-containing protein [Crenotrichaceae bacterium]